MFDYITPKKESDPVYEVGITNDGRTTLKIGSNTLTMTYTGVIQLIKLLESTIMEDEEAKTNEV